MANTRLMVMPVRSRLFFEIAQTNAYPVNACYVEDAE
jgi:hypothetical protein